MSEKIPLAFQLGEKSIDSVTITPISFSTFGEILSQAQVMKEPKTLDGRVKRLRMHKQVTYHLNGSTIPISIEEMLRIPLRVAKQISDKVDASNEGKAGKVIRDGDGVDVAVGYELGVPIPTGKNSPPITELEFMAKTYGDIEDVLAAGDSMEQTRALIQTIAKPVHTSLSVLPSWAIEQISIADGVTIARLILPKFLE